MKRDRLNPNKKTIAAMKAAERGEVTTVGHPRNLLKSLRNEAPIKSDLAKTARSWCGE